MNYKGLIFPSTKFLNFLPFWLLNQPELATVEFAAPILVDLTDKISQPFEWFGAAFRFDGCLAHWTLQLWVAMELGENRCLIRFHSSTVNVNSNVSGFFRAFRSRMIS